MNCQYSSLSSQQTHGRDSVGRSLSHTLANSHEHDTRDHQRTSRKDQKPRSSGIEDGTDKYAAQEGQEDICAEDPSYGARTILRQLVCG